MRIDEQKAYPYFWLVCLFVWIHYTKRQKIPPTNSGFTAVTCLNVSSGARLYPSLPWHWGEHGKHIEAILLNNKQ